MAKTKKELKELKIVYDLNRTGFSSEEIDNALEAVAKQFGYEFDGSGYDFETNKRDLLFTKEIECPS